VEDFNVEKIFFFVLIFSPKHKAHILLMILFGVFCQNF